MKRRRILLWLLLWQVYFSILPVLRQKKRKQKIIPDINNTFIGAAANGHTFPGLVILSE